MPLPGERFVSMGCACAQRSDSPSDVVLRLRRLRLQIVHIAPVHAPENTSVVHMFLAN